MSELRASVGIISPSQLNAGDVEIAPDRGGVVRVYGPMVFQERDFADVTLEKKIERHVARALLVLIGQLPVDATVADLRQKLASDMATELLDEGCGGGR